MPSRRQAVRNVVLARRGLRAKKHGGVEKDVAPPLPPRPYVVPDSNPKKTSRMRRVEARLNCRLEEVLMAGTLYELEELLDVDFTTVSKWRKRLGLV